MAATTLTVCSVPAGTALLPQADPALVEAFAYSLTAAQIAARASDADPSSAEYFEAMAAAMVHCGWNRLAAHAFVHLAQPAPIAPIDVLTEAMAQFLQETGPDAPPAWQDLVAWLPGLRRAEMSRTRSADAVLGSGMTIGPLLQWRGAPWLMAVHLVFGAPVAGWPDLFEPLAGLALTARPLCLQLDLDRYEAQAPALKARLAATLEQHIRQTTLQLDAPASEAQS
ncbi:hypothetical protein [Aquabacterium humicola]|uniref:hypothetical protein n=1 Tax=Aquabacterium humicola TaxID=3237377 RepID=UPI0025433285|nr:hypothetical protein [Rubrivivax pictus]